MTSVFAEETSGNVWRGLLKVLDDLPTGRKPKLVRGDNAFSNDAMTALEQGAALPTERLILVLKPRERVLKMLQIKIRPIFIPDIEIRIDRLHREKTAQSASSSPAYNQIQT